MANRTLFKNRYGAVNVHLKNGKAVRFANSMHFTLDDDEQKELQAMADKSEAGIYVDPENKTVDPNAASPQELMEQRMLQKLMREHPTLRNAVAQAGAGDSLAKFLQNSSIGNTANEAGGNARLANGSLPDGVVINSQTGKPEQKSAPRNLTNDPVDKTTDETSDEIAPQTKPDGIQPTEANSVKNKFQTGTSQKK